MARYALVIGISRYDNFRNLDKAATDAAAIARIFQSHGQYQVEPLPKRLFEAENRWELATDKKLTAQDLGQALETFLLERAKDQEALIYFAGHGFEVPGLGRKQKGYLATSDSTSDGRNAILFSDLNDLIRESSLSSLVLILDCCHAGSFLERTLLESTLTAFKEKKDYYLITACRSFERAREGEEHGVFTAAVLKGLQADNADREGAVTGDRLFDFVQRELRQSGQEPIRMGIGRSITLVNYQPQAKTVTAIVDEHGEVICPYQGLQAFTAAQREFFFGRKRIVEAIKQNLEQQPFVPVIGASGSGKSSVVRAGLMPWLAESGWCILEPIKPGFDPLAALRGVFEPFFKRSRSEIQTLHQLIAHDSIGLSGVIERLPGDGGYLLVVDQFEEVFTVCANEAERQRFIELITQVAEIQNSRLAIVTTMRADFLEPCLHYPALHHLIQSQAVFMPPLTGIDLRDAITEPAKRQGYTVEEALLLRILEDVGKEPGFLPLLEFALTKLWEKRDTESYLLKLEEYEKLGGLTGTLNLHAERVYHYQDYEAEFPADQRTEQEKEWIKRIFLRLVRTGEGEKDTRQRQLKANLLVVVGDDLQNQEALRELLDGENGLVQGRLLVAGKDEQKADWTDLAHEALIDGWQQFVEWRKKDRDLRRLGDRLRDALRQWQNGFCDNELMMGGLLVQVKENWQVLEPELDRVEREFYQRSVIYEQDQITQLQRALFESKQRQQEAERNEIRALCISADALFSLGQIRSSLLEALKAGTKLIKVSWKASDTEIRAQVTTALLQAICWIKEWNCLEGHVDSVYSISLSPNGQILASGSRDKSLRLWKLDGTPLERLMDHEDRVLSVSFSPDGHTFASSSRDGTVKLRHRDGSLVRTFTGQSNCVVNQVCFSPDGQLLAFGDKDGSIKLWNINGQLINTLVSHKSNICDVVFSLDGTLLASVDRDGIIKLWSSNGGLLRTIVGHANIINKVSMSPDGRIIATASDDKTVKLWNYDGSLLRLLADSDTEYPAVTFSPDGQTIATGRVDGTIELWQIDGTLLNTLKGHVGYIHDLKFSADGQVLASASGDRTIRIWQLSNSLTRVVRAHTHWAMSVLFSPDGKLIVSTSGNSEVKLWYSDGTFFKTLKGHERYVSTASFSPDSQLIASGSHDKTIKIWHHDGNLIATLRGHQEAVRSVCFNPVNGKILVSGSYDRTVKLWKCSGELIRTIEAHNDRVLSVNFSPDGKTFVTGSSDRIIKLWALDGTLLTSFSGHGDSVTSVKFSPDGNILASASEDKTIKLWQLDGTLIATLTGHSINISSLEFSSDGRILASASGDKTVKLWHQDGTLITTLKGHTTWIGDVSFSPDNQVLATADSFGTLILWDLSYLEDNLLDRLIVYGCNWLQNYLRANPSVEESDRHLCDGICD